MSPYRLSAVAALALVAPTTSPAQPAQHAVAAQAIDVWSFGYAPRPIHLRAGQPVTLTFVNRSNGGHDFTARAFFASSRILAGAAPGGKVGLPPGQARSITLVPRAGSYPVHCSHFLHKQFGMEDRILVH